MSLFNNEEIKKILWPAFKWKTGKKIKITKSIEKNSDDEDEKINENEEYEDIEEETKLEKKVKPKKDNEKQLRGQIDEIIRNVESKIEVDEVLEIKTGSILRIDGEEFQIHIDIKENQEILTNYIHKKVIDPNGIINKWEYKNAELKYDKEDNIFYYVLESPKKG